MQCTAQQNDPDTKAITVPVRTDSLAIVTMSESKANHSIDERSTL